MKLFNDSFKISISLFFLFLPGMIRDAGAVETVSNGTAIFKTNDNIGSSVPGWNTGWGGGVDGWNYVGAVSDASGVYLGNNWVLTAAHVINPVSFTLGGNVYNATGLAYTDFTNSLTGTTNADLHLFQISNSSTTGTNISLTGLTLASSAPNSGQTVVMIGYGGSNGQGPESWGTNSVYGINQYPISVNGYESIDFTTINLGQNYATVVLGDSGGGDFIKVGTNWVLAGINEAVVTYGTNSGAPTGSAFVQLSSYNGQIASIVNSVPEPSTWGLAAMGLIGIGFILFRRSIAR